MNDANAAYWPMLMAFSHCIGSPILKLQINTPSRTTWNTGAFATAALCGWDGKPQKLLEAGDDDSGANCSMQFELECMRPGDPGPGKVSVKLNLIDSSGKKSELRVNCPPVIFGLFNWARMELSESPKGTDDPNEHIVYADAGEITLIDDLPRCREVVERLCREITLQLWECGYLLRPGEVMQEIG